MIRVIVRVAAGLAVAIILALVGGFLWIKSSAPSLNGNHAIAGLTGNATIVRDEYGIPHIFAETPEGAYTALGFAHAQDRLAQMEFLRWVAQGRLAEKVGAAGVETDKLSRTLNLKKIGELSQANADDDTVQAFKKYADGINAFINSHKGAWPLEFLLLGERPEPWTVSDIFSLSGLMLFSIPDWQDELTYAKFSEQLSSEQMEDFFRPYPEDAPVTYSSEASARGASHAHPLDQKNPLPGWPFKRGGFASNTWVVHGSRTKTGKPLLASDPHGGFTAPIDYYLARIEAPGVEIRGVGAPGFPAFLLGHNSDIAWGLTDLGADVSDLFLERRIDEESYLGPNGPLPFVTRDEVINVKGGEDVVFKVRETRHGPVISDVHNGAAEYAEKFGPEHVVSLSVEASARGISFTNAVFRINKAQNWDDFVAALENYDFQHNFSYADRDGNIGMVSAARLPERKAAGKLPRKGWLADDDWAHVIPVAAALREKNPQRGFIANANNRLTPSGSPFEASSAPSPKYRIQRITDLLSSNSNSDIEAMISIQSDVVSLAARELLPMMTAIKGRDEKAQSALRLLRDWDAEMHPERPEPLIYVAWLREFSRLVIEDEFGALANEWSEPREHFVSLVLEDRSQWCDNVTTEKEETCESLLEMSLDTALKTIAEEFGDNEKKWAYGKAHEAQFTHAIFQSIPILSSMSEAKASVGGDDRTINAAAVSYDEETLFQSSFGARYRQIIDLDNLSNSRFILAPGPSGNIFSPYYKNLAEKWAKVEYITLDGAKDEVASRGAGVIELHSE